MGMNRQTKQERKTIEKYEKDYKSNIEMCLQTLKILIKIAEVQEYKNTDWYKSIMLKFKSLINEQID